MNQRFFDAVQASPIIAAVKDDAGLKRCLAKEDIHIIFVLYGDLCSIVSIVSDIQRAGKLAIVHMDLITGLAQKEVSVDYIANTVHADGIISTRRSLIQRAKALRLCTVWRVFIIDSMALAEAQSARDLKPDFLEILPGLMPGIIRSLKTSTGIPILTGGLIRTKQDVTSALNAGAMAISTTNESVWDM